MENMQPRWRRWKKMEEEENIKKMEENDEKDQTQQRWGREGGKDTGCCEDYIKWFNCLATFYKCKTIIQIGDTTLNNNILSQFISFSSQIIS